MDDPQATGRALEDATAHEHEPRLQLPIDRDWTDFTFSNATTSSQQNPDHEEYAIEFSVYNNSSISANEPLRCSSHQKRRYHHRIGAAPGRTLVPRSSSETPCHTRTDEPPYLPPVKPFDLQGRKIPSMRVKSVHVHWNAALATPMRAP